MIGASTILPLNTDCSLERARHLYCDKVLAPGEPGGDLCQIWDGMVQFSTDATAVALLKMARTLDEDIVVGDYVVSPVSGPLDNPYEDSLLVMNQATGDRFLFGIEVDEVLNDKGRAVFDEIDQAIYEHKNLRTKAEQAASDDKTNWGSPRDNLVPRDLAIHKLTGGPSDKNIIEIGALGFCTSDDNLMISTTNLNPDHGHPEIDVFVHGPDTLDILGALQEAAVKAGLQEDLENGFNHAKTLRYELPADLGWQLLGEMGVAASVEDGGVYGPVSRKTVEGLWQIAMTEDSRDVADMTTGCVELLEQHGFTSEHGAYPFNQDRDKAKVVQQNGTRRTIDLTDNDGNSAYLVEIDDPNKDHPAITLSLCTGSDEARSTNRVATISWNQHENAHQIALDHSLNTWSLDTMNRLLDQVMSLDSALAMDYRIQPTDIAP